MEGPKKLKKFTNGAVNKKGVDIEKKGYGRPWLTFQCQNVNLSVKTETFHKSTNDADLIWRSHREKRKWVGEVHCECLLGNWDGYLYYSRVIFWQFIISREMAILNCILVLQVSFPKVGCACFVDNFPETLFQTCSLVFPDWSHNYMVSI